MKMTRGNRAIRRHQKQGYQLHLFEAVGDGNVRYIGEAAYLDYRREFSRTLGEIGEVPSFFEIAEEPGGDPGVSSMEEPVEDNRQLTHRGRVQSRTDPHTLEPQE